MTIGPTAAPTPVPRVATPGALSSSYKLANLRVAPLRNDNAATGNRLILRQKTYLLAVYCPTVRQPAVRFGFSATDWALSNKTSHRSIPSLATCRTSNGDSGSGFTNR